MGGRRQHHLTPVRIPMPEGWGEACLREIGQAAPRADHQVRSYDHCGRQLVWTPPAGWAAACDLEDGGRPVPELAARWGISEPEFRRRWVVTEVLAKLHGESVLAWLQRHGLANIPGLIEGVPVQWAGARVRIETVPATGGVAAFGYRPASTEDGSWN